MGSIRRARAEWVQILLRRRDFDGVGSAGANGAAGGWVEGLIEADFYGGEEVVAAGEGQG
jgi:hypothetical protein